MNHHTEWTGLVSSQWTNPQNWTAGIPNSHTHAYLPAKPQGLHFPRLNECLTLAFTIKNDGVLEIADTITLGSQCLLQNQGTLQIENTGSLRNEGTIMNNGELVNAGTIDNLHLLTNNGHLHNEGLIDNENTLLNLSNLLNAGIIENHQLMSNSGNLENFNIIDHTSEGEFVNQGFFPEEIWQEMSEKVILSQHHQMVPQEQNA